MNVFYYKNKMTTNSLKWLLDFRVKKIYIFRLFSFVEMTEMQCCHHNIAQEYLQLGSHCAILLLENLDDSCGNYRSDYVVEAVVYTVRSLPDSINN